MPFSLRQGRPSRGQEVIKECSNRQLYRTWPGHSHLGGLDHTSAAKAAVNLAVIDVLVIALEVAALPHQ